MRRIGLWGLVTVTVLVLLFSYHTSTSSRFAPSQAAVSDPEPVDTTPTLDPGRFDGDAIVTRFGVVQVRITVHDGRMTSVEALQVPNRDRHDYLINERAVPILNAEAVRTQSADVDLVSGATLTSHAYAESLQSAIDKASG
ncbi:MAG TPA: FMN-binding protein [Lapillicoccus sp.]|nr:FMN-binding protein [Lapillicoccus sp.]